MKGVTNRQKKQVIPRKDKIVRPGTLKFHQKTSEKKLLDRKNLGNINFK